MAENSAPRRCGVVSLVGAPNAGKSTLLNTLVGSKIAAVTHKVQTTRSRIVGIAMAGPAQLVFVDTPGILAPKRRLERAMVAAAWHGARDADAVVLLVDASRGIDADTRRIASGLKEAGIDAVLAINKVDVTRRETLLGLARALNDLFPFLRTFMISGMTGDGVEELRQYVAASVPLGPWLYPPDQIADLPLRALAAEITREKLFLSLHEELPYATTVEPESWDERSDGSVQIAQVITVRRASQKAIVLGKNGRQIKAIGTEARVELEKILERRVHLSLFVKVRADWLDDPERYRQIGLTFPR